jgi:hypothetical protein
MPNSRPLSDSGFQIEMFKQMKDLAVEQESIHSDTASCKEHLVRLNSKVADHETKVGAIQIELAERRHQYPLNENMQDRLRPLEDWITAEKASSRTSATWLKWLWPVIWALAGAFALLILLHAASISSTILKFHP